MRHLHLQLGHHLDSESDRHNRPLTEIIVFTLKAHTHPPSFAASALESALESADSSSESADSKADAPVVMLASADSP